MTEQRQAVKFRLLRIEGTAQDSRAIPVDLFKTLDEAVAASEELVALWPTNPSLDHRIRRLTVGDVPVAYGYPLCACIVAWKRYVMPGELLRNR